MKTNLLAPHFSLRSTVANANLPHRIIKETQRLLSEPVFYKGIVEERQRAKSLKRSTSPEQDKLKREHFLDLASILELNQTNNGKASILSEAARLLKELYGKIESLKQENASLISESQYVTIEKNELKEENSALETQIEKLQARVAQSKPDLNMPPSDYQSAMPHTLERSIMFPAADSLEFFSLHGFAYFVNHRNKPLRYSADLPCMNVGKPKRPTYIPLKLCHMVSLQHYTKALSTLQRASLVEKSRQKPQERMNTLSHALKSS